VVILHLESHTGPLALDWLSSGSIELVVNLWVTGTLSSTVVSDDVAVNFDDWHLLDVLHSAGLVGIGSSLRKVSKFCENF
jgi:hypothetical protein